MKLTLDFIAATNFRYLATEHKKGTSLAKNAFSALSHFLHSKTGQRVFPCDAGKVRSLGPFGIRNALDVAENCSQIFVPACMVLRAF